MKKSITLIGMMGAGKSILAECLAQSLHELCAVDTDSLIEYHYNKSIPDMFQEKGESGFRDVETKMIDMVYKRDNLIVALGGGAFEREQNRKLVKEKSCVVYLKASPEILFKRLKNTKNRPLLKEGFTVETIEKILSSREANYMQADVVVETDNKTPGEIVKELLGKLND